MASRKYTRKIRKASPPQELGGNLDDAAEYPGDDFSDFGTNEPQTSTGLTTETSDRARVLAALIFSDMGGTVNVESREPGKIEVTTQNGTRWTVGIDGNKVMVGGNPHSPNLTQLAGRLSDEKLLADLIKSSKNTTTLIQDADFQGAVPEPVQFGTPQDQGLGADSFGGDEPFLEPAPQVQGPNQMMPPAGFPPGGEVFPPGSMNPQPPMGGVPPGPGAYPPAFPASSPFPTASRRRAKPEVSLEELAKKFEHVYRAFHEFYNLYAYSTEPFASLLAGFQYAHHKLEHALKDRKKKKASPHISAWVRNLDGVSSLLVASKNPQAIRLATRLDVILNEFEEYNRD